LPFKCDLQRYIVDFVSDMCYVPPGDGGGGGVDPAAPSTSAAGAAAGAAAINGGTLVATSGRVGYVCLTCQACI
jgi:hypothetical protein